jgi:hypothetical protein
MRRVQAGSIARGCGARLRCQYNDGVIVNCWTSTDFLAASATTNETVFCTYKVVRSTGMVVFDNQARV